MSASFMRSSCRHLRPPKRRRFCGKPKPKPPYLEWVDGSPIIRVALPAFIPFGFVGLLISRHKITYVTKTQGIRDEQTLAGLQHEFIPRPSIYRVATYMGVLCLASQVAWISGLKGSPNAWGAIQTIITGPLYRSYAFGNRVMLLSYAHIMALCIARNVYKEIYEIPPRKKNTRRTVPEQIFFDNFWEILKAAFGFYSQTFWFMYPGCITASCVFHYVNRFYWMKQIAPFAKPRGVQKLILGKITYMQ